MTEHAGDHVILDALNALIATGADRWDAVITMLEGGANPSDIPGLSEVPQLFWRRFRDDDAALAGIRALAMDNPKGANAAANMYLAGRRTTINDPGVELNGEWLTSLPAGFSVGNGGLCDLRGTGLKTLPEGFTVEGSLWLNDSHIETLPKGLRIGAKETLDLRRCAAWDGQIPDDAVMGFVITDEHIGEGNGVTLDEWRRLYPNGEPRKPREPLGIDEVVPVATPRVTPKEMMTALQASGADRFGAFGGVVATFGLESVRPLWEGIQIGRLDSGTLFRFIDNVGKTEPDVARLLLDDAFRSGTMREWDLERWDERREDDVPVSGLHFDRATWIVDLRGPLTVDGTLAMEACSGLKSLPCGLTVSGSLLLNECCALVSLPTGMVVGSNLQLNDCPAWDGKIPADAIICGNVITDGEPDGVSLSEWRKAHPDGERG